METPEHVAVGYALAGPGSRFAAFLIDVVLLVLGLSSLVIGGTVLLSAMTSAGVVISATAPVLVALVMLGIFATTWGYFIYFEGFRDGQTPGKKRFGLRVVHEGGYPLTLRGAAIRNLVRIIDLQPAPSCLLGGAMILIHPRAQRLGDLAAGTMVVRERATGGLPEEIAAQGPPLLSEREYEVLSSFAQQREALDAGTLERIVADLTTHFAGHWGEATPVEGVSAERTASIDEARLLRLHAEESGRRAAAGAANPSGSRSATALVQRQSARWAEYRALLSRVDKRGVASLPEVELSAFAGLYREITADLARARTYGASPQLLYSLERLVSAGHNLLYTPAPHPPRRALKWLASGFPRLARKRARAIAAAALLLFAPALVSFGAVAADAGRARMLLPAEIIARAEVGAVREDAGVGYAEVPEMMMPIFSSQIIANNVQVSFAAFAGGILGGLGTAAILIFNGIFLGGTAGLFHAEGLSLYLWSFIAPHGVLELTAICVAGGAGLWLGSAILIPGRRTRREALGERARESISLLAGAVVLLIIAGLIEGFVSPAPLPNAAKLSVGALSGLVLGGYFLFGGRS